MHVLEPYHTQDWGASYSFILNRWNFLKYTLGAFFFLCFVFPLYLFLLFVFPPWQLKVGAL